MSELPEGIPAAEPPTPQPSASGLVLRRGAFGAVEVLLGLRSRRSRFMPGYLVFPGGVIDPEDRPQEPGAYVRCVAREVREETGVEIPVGAWLEAGERVTPELFPVRFRTRFYLATLPDDAALPDRPPSPEEIETLRFAMPDAALEEWARGISRIPPPALPLLRALAEHQALPAAELAAYIARANGVEQRSPRIEFAPTVWMLPVRTATLPPATHTNVWMPGGGRFAIVDPGSPDPEEIARLLDVVERRRSIGQDPAIVLLTHGHRDHVGGVHAIARALKVPLAADETVLGSLVFDGDDVELRPLADGAELDLDGVMLQAVSTPGHAPGHLAFHLPQKRLLIAGDLLSGISTILIDPDHGDMGDYLDSLARVQALDCETLFPGHGPPLPGSAVGRLIAHRGDRERRIVEQLSEAYVDIAGIAGAAYADVPQMPLALTERQTLAHLGLLERRGRVEAGDGERRTWRLARA